MKSLRNWALASTAATYLLIFVGGLVRVSGAGLGCPDWPKCYGSWIPPTDVSQLPPDVNPATFNVTLAWIEYINRLIGVTIGLFITVTSVLAIVHARTIPRVLIPILAALVLVAFEGWQGSVVVGSKLAPFVVTIHMGLAFLIVSLLLYATLKLYHLTSSTAPTTNIRDNRRGYRAGIAVLWMLSLLEIALGTQVRSEISTLARSYPLISDLELLSLVGWFDDAHMIVGGFVVIATFQVGVGLLRNPQGRSPLATQSIWLMMLIAIAQVILGVVLLGISLAPLLQLFHLWLSCFYIGALLTLHFALSHEGTPNVRYAA